MKSDQQSCQSTPVAADEAVATSPRSPWSPPTVTRIDIKRTLNGASVALDSSLFTTF